MVRLRVFPVVATLLAGSFLAGCSGTSNFDPTSWLDSDMFSTKTPLPGQRKAVFPEGVPGVPQGVPRELVKGSQQQQQAAIEAAEPPPAEAEPAPKPAPKPAAARPAPKPRTASAPPATRPAPPQPAAQRPAANQPSADWPDGGAVHPPETPRQTAPQSDANWPPPDASTFSR